MKKIIVCLFLALAVITTCNAQKNKEKTRKRFAVSSVKQVGPYSDMHFEYSYNEKKQVVGVSYTRTERYDTLKISFGKGAVSYDDRGNVIKFEYTTGIVGGKEESGYTEFSYDGKDNLKLVRKFRNENGKIVLAEEKRCSYDEKGTIREILSHRDDKPFSITVFKYNEKDLLSSEVITAQDTAVGLYPWGAPQKIERFYEYDENGNMVVWSEKNDGNLFCKAVLTENNKKNYKDQTTTYFSQVTGKKTDMMFSRDYYNDGNDRIESLFQQKSMGINNKTFYSYDSIPADEVVRFNDVLREYCREFFFWFLPKDGHRLVGEKVTGKFYIMGKSRKSQEEIFFEYRKL